MQKKTTINRSDITPHSPAYTRNITTNETYTIHHRPASFKEKHGSPVSSFKTDNLNNKNNNIHKSPKRIRIERERDNALTFENFEYLINPLAAYGINVEDNLLCD